MMVLLLAVSFVGVVLFLVLNSFVGDMGFFNILDDRFSQGEEQVV